MVWLLREDDIYLRGGLKFFIVVGIGSKIKGDREGGRGGYENYHGNGGGGDGIVLISR